MVESEREIQRQASVLGPPYLIIESLFLNEEHICRA